MGLEEMRQLAWSVLAIQLLGIAMLAVGLGSLSFCRERNDHSHSKDKWVLFLPVIAVLLASIFFANRYNIFELLPANSNFPATRFQPLSFLQAAVWSDSLALFIVVMLSGGLTKSFYSQLFVLVPPLAVLLQKEPTASFTTSLFVATAVSVTLSALVNLPSVEKQLRGRGFNSTTDHAHHNFSLWLVTVLGVGMVFADFYFRHKH